MALNVTIPDNLAERLEAAAKAMSKTPQEAALEAIERELTSLEGVDEVLAPIREAFLSSAMTEDEAVDLFEAEKHALRQERRSAGAK